MIVVKLIGGLGNQLFQYALGRHLALLHKTELKLDITGFEEYKLHAYSLNHFNITENFATKEEVAEFQKFMIKPEKKWFLHNMFIADPSKYFQEKMFNFDPQVLTLPDDIYLDGFWQTEKYFKEIELVIRREFAFVSPQGEKDKEISRMMTNGNAISLHIRRADYVTRPNTNKTHGTCSIEYYERAMKLLAGKTADPRFFVFSDDHEWVKQNIKSVYPTVYVDHNNAATNYQDLRLMASCKHNIIANSTFSWWGAWLNNNPDKIVVAPKRWFADETKNTRDILPAAWIRV